MIQLKDVMENDKIKMLIDSANKALEIIGYTEHGRRHVSYVSRTAKNILAELGFDNRTQELAAITGYVHDVGNFINRNGHGIIGAQLLMPVLSEMNMQYDEILVICGAVGNHEEQNGTPISPVSAALIIADKSDAHRTRVRKNKPYDPQDIHDRVNYSIKKNMVVVDKDKRIISFRIIMDTNLSSVMDFFQIYLSRMVLSEQAANFLDCRFELVINDTVLNRPV